MHERHTGQVDMVNLELETKRDQRFLVAVLTGELDHHSAETVRGALDLELEVHHDTWLILDLGGLTFMDSSGLGVILGRYRKIRSLGGEMAIVNIPHPLEKVVQIAGLQKIMHIYHSSNEALHDMKGGLQ
jgi:stage II sporulation protein AA (anti-sigma F factor antagonist)